jgi:hypothetical protein
LITQRLALAVRRQAWSTLALELIVVVAGILIALQVDNWNEHRKRLVEAREWRQQIIIDLQATGAELQGRVNYYQAGLEFGETGLTGLQSDNAVTASQAWEIVLGAFQAGQIWPYRLTGPTYREAQNAGGLGLVADAGTLTALAQLYDVTAHDFELITGGLPKYREMVRERIPWEVQEHIWDADCQSTINRPGERGHAFMLVDCKQFPDGELLVRTVDDLRKDETLKQALVGRLSQLKVSSSSMARSIERIDSLITMLHEDQ